ncbi:hypothetical protein AVEN_175535-1 [Araneus ventricosus]|uniref:Uncharacterized protein n=1 Tax=Araneus ventricosus TaxID=182803 RepID=A0A4Y2CP45_ARAVE|nr:hypothetical protein AVEN_175535-1 [Araneus ventricosus]
MESSKSKSAAASAPFEIKEIGIQTVSASIHPSKPTRIQAPIEHKEVSTQTFSTESPPPSQSKPKEQGNTARQNLTFAEALRKKSSPAILLYPKSTAENKIPVEEILKKELFKPDFNVQNIKKVKKRISRRLR